MSKIKDKNKIKLKLKINTQKAWINEKAFLKVK